ncbi:streptomycin 6-kinase/streptomycin 6-kinase [Actinopolymorpha cephalotaxi]|uniref:Streptomycin 6-kinase n=1 Tax=Actinopolymorpha cephalotaxi TaxID=504797 RepID=A0A1I2N6X6_9ACTN|nr:aminoglycoside phosphotransferase family protein [Actinopolymorpha cephalotaxi]NYH85690.1 streptomycin 6-kinase [Actinopolymorpha cephalotaxi]SFF98589.1 streptomycin 6-kinase/streptomycin 6-kinase [Actinopolymorpha cephalotaxi]
MIDVPELFVRETVRREGDTGERWIATLPGLVEELLEKWACTPTGPVMHGKVGVVVPVRRHDGSPAVLKVSFPHPGNVDEPTAYAAWAGRGAVCLYERDDARFAMLLERVEQTTLVEIEDDDEAAAVCGRLTRLLAVPAPPGLRRLSDRAEEQERELSTASQTLISHVPRRVVDAALATIRELGREQPETLVHGDLHYTNVVRANREPWLVIDPKGFAGDPANDAFSVVVGSAQRQVAVDDLCRQLRRRLAIFADAAELERERVIRWAQAHSLLHACWARNASDPEGTAALAERVAAVLT